MMPSAPARHPRNPHVLRVLSDYGPSVHPRKTEMWAEEVRPPEPLEPDHSLPSVLQRSSAVFETWRYLYEAGELGKVNPRYEFHYLGVAADVLHAHAGQVAQGIRGTRGTGE